ncbi:PIN domain-containing protein [Candidatus Woesearchaeota archaeon]|nr:PIN domain-containing protein [Candidatus Woesearchaeota archaeon]
MDVKFLDTYALVEISNGNPKFTHFLNESFVILDLILAEFYGILLREYNEKTANFWCKKFEIFSYSANLDLLKKAVKYRQENKEKNFSFFDATGYVYAQENNMKFVTGDQAFEDVVGVEYIKK